MIPKLTIDMDAIKENWKKHPDDWESIAERCRQIEICGGDFPPVYACDECWIELGVFKEYKKYVRPSLIDYGYCSTEESLVKYLKKYIDSDEKYFVNVGLLSMENEKYYKFGSYIDKDGNNTEDDYDFDSEEKQQYEGYWIHFSITKLL